MNSLSIHLLLISELKEGAGGRETWIVNFLQELLSKEPSIIISLYYIYNNESTVIDFLAEKYGDRLRLNEIKSNKLIGKINKTLDFCWGLFLYRKKMIIGVSDLYIGVGGLFEGVAGLIGFCKIKKIIWLRTIYTREIANRRSTLALFFISKFEKYIYKKHINYFIANGNDTEFYYKSICERIITIPNSIDTKIWDVEKNLDSKIKIAYVGRLTEVKGIRDFLESIKIFSGFDEFDKCQFFVYGSGEYLSAVKDFSEQGLLIFKGVAKNKELIAIYAEIDAGVNLTYGASEFGGAGISHSLLEQLASGMTIIAWDNDIYTNVITQENGVLVKEKDVYGLIDAYKNIIYNRNYFKSQVCDNNKMLAQRYDIDNHVKLFIKFLDGQFRNSKKNEDL